MDQFEGYEYKIERDGAYRWDTLVKVGDEWKLAVPSALWTSGPRWEAEMKAFISKQKTA